MVGALRNSNVPARVEMSAVDRAFVLVGGWTAKDKGAIGKALTELKEVTAHNQEVYEKAADALTDLGKREAALVKAGKASTLAVATAADQAARSTAKAAQISQAARKLEADTEQARKSFNATALLRTGEMQTHEKALDVQAREAGETEKALTAREMQVTKRETAIEALAARISNGLIAVKQAVRGLE